MFEILISKSATTEDTVSLIRQTINNYFDSNIIKSIISQLDKTNKHRFLKGINDYLAQKIIYERDPVGHELVTTPKRLINQGFGDCKKMTVFIACILKKMQWPFLLKVVSYDGNYWHHIYVIIPDKEEKKGYITLDPVNYWLYNQEVAYKVCKIYNMAGKSWQSGKLKSNTLSGIISDIAEDLIF